MARVLASTRWVCAALLALPVAAQEPPAARAWWGAVEGGAQLARMLVACSDSNLEVVFERTWGEWEYFEPWSVADACLLEMVRRGGPRWREYLDQVVAADPDPRFYEELTRDAVAVELATARRRIDGARDPLHVRLDEAAPIEAVFPELPILAVRLENGDPEHALSLTQGGDYRSGRSTRWRIEARGAEGNRIDVRARYGGDGGGLWTIFRLPPGRTSTMTWSLPVDRYVELPGPGTYTLVVQYHDHRPIAGLDHVRGLIVARSAPVQLTWRPREIRYAPGERAELEALVDALVEERRIAVSWAWTTSVELPPAAAAVDARGFRALPALLDRLEADEDVAHRARLLAMLTNLTGLNAPRIVDGFRERALGSYRTPTGSDSDGGPDARGQRRLVEAWRRARAGVVVVE